MEIQKCTLTQLRDQMSPIVELVAHGKNVFRITKVNKDTGVILAPAVALDDEDALVARLLEIAPGRLATDQELEAR